MRRRRAAGLLVAVVAIAAVLGSRSLGSSSPTASSPSTASRTATAASPVDAPRREHRGPLGEADGAVPDATTIFDDDVPGVAKLDPALLGALRRAAADAGNDGVAFVVDSGWRSEAYQQHLLQEAIAEYGSEAEAARWVARPETSAHVSGNAIDLGRDAAAWLSEHGAAYGLCPVYGNEPWHYELRPDAGDQGCPTVYADPTQDPRMRR
jgi:hypothetical protein